MVCGVIRAISVLALSSYVSFAQFNPAHYNRGNRAQPLSKGSGSIHPGLGALRDRGPAPSSLTISHVTVLLRRSPERQLELERFLEEVQNLSSPNYHRWLTPQEFGVRFGADPVDTQLLTGWLAAKGFTVEPLGRSMSRICFSGTVGQIRAAFLTDIHLYGNSANDKFAFGNVAKDNFAALREPALPERLRNIAGYFRGLDDFTLKPLRNRLPLYNMSDGTHAITPLDLAAIYNITNIPSGEGKTIAVAGQSAIQLSDIRGFRSTFQLPPVDPKLVLFGTDPGLLRGGDMEEGTIDLEWAGVAAPSAQLLYAYATDVGIAAEHIVESNLAHILSMSYGACEPSVSQADASFFRGLAQQASAQGISWIAASGDSGATGCNNRDNLADQGLAVTFPASVPEVVAVGGTRFEEGSRVYWSGLNAGLGSAFGYIPESGWNDTPLGFGLSASGGGSSVLFPKPSWQTGDGVPDNSARNVPDLALAASYQHDPFLALVDGKTYAAGGTSIGAPIFAGIVAALARNSRLGNLAPFLYRAAAGATSPFHDISTGSNIVPCVAGSKDCDDGELGFNASLGYDLVTGLGSPNVSLLDTAFASQVGITLTPDRSQVNEGSAIQVTVHIQALNGANLSGLVHLYDGDSALTAVRTDASGDATVSIVFPSAGPHLLSARFEGQFLSGVWPKPFTTAPSGTISLYVVPAPLKAPVQSAPANGEPSFPLNGTLSWNASGTYVSYDIYLGTVSPPPYWGTTAATTFSPAGLTPAAKYYWKILARNEFGTASSPILSFTASPGYRLSRKVGTGASGISPDGLLATNSSISYPSSIAFDKDGLLYFVDYYNYRIRKVGANGIAVTVAGQPAASNDSGDGGPAVKATLNPRDIAFDRQGNLYVTSSRRIRRITPDGIISTVAGDGTLGPLNDGGPAIEAHLSYPLGLAADASGTLFFADEGDNCVRQISAGTITTIAGICGAMPPSFRGPSKVAINSVGEIYFIDILGMWKISHGVTTPVGIGEYPQAIAFDPADNLYYFDGGGNYHQLHKFSDGLNSIVAGGGFLEPADGVNGIDAGLNVAAIAVSSTGTPYIAADNVIWALNPDQQPPESALGTGGIVNAASFASAPVAPGSIAAAFGSFVITGSQAAKKVPLPSIVAGISIQLDSGAPILAPVFYASPTQVNFQIPWELAGQTVVTIAPMLNGHKGPSQQVRVAPYSPGIFTLGSNQAAVVDTLGRVVGPTNPATAESILQIYCTGLGLVDKTPSSGDAASLTALSSTTERPVVFIGGTQAEVLFSGLAPGSVGEYQVNVRVPKRIAALSSTNGAGTAVPITVSIGGVTSNTATIALR